MSKTSQEQEILKLMRDYHHYMKFCEQAANSQTSRTVVKTAIDDANKVEQNLVAKITKLISKREI